LVSVANGFMVNGGKRQHRGRPGGGIVVGGGIMVDGGGIMVDGGGIIVVGGGGIIVVGGGGIIVVGGGIIVVGGGIMRVDGGGIIVVGSGGTWHGRQQMQSLARSPSLAAAAMVNGERGTGPTAPLRHSPATTIATLPPAT
jgi:hypothetical protein